MKNDKFTLEQTRTVYNNLHGIYKEFVGEHPSLMTAEEKSAAAVAMIDNAFLTFNGSQQMLWTYDMLSNPDTADGGCYSFSGQLQMLRCLGKEAYAEMKFYAEVSSVYYEMYMVHAIKMPWFLKHLGKNLDIRNDKLCDFLWENNHEMFSLRLACCMGKVYMDKQIGVNGIYYDELSEVVFSNKETKDSTSREEIVKRRNEVVNTIYHMDNHEQIGRMLGLRRWQLGNYDAIQGWFHEPFNPRIVKMAKELNRFIRSIQYLEIDIIPDTPQGYVDMLHNKLMSLAEKYEVTIYNEQLTFDYIFGHNSHILPDMDEDEE